MTDTGKPLTGRKVLLIAVAAFGLVIAANLTLLFTSLGSFPGLVVKNSYVASQGYDAERRAQAALGWTVSTRHENGVLSVAITDAAGAPVRALAVAATVGRPASQADDLTLTLTPDTDGYSAPAALAPGLWRVEIAAETADGARWRGRADLRLKDLQ